MPTGVRSLCSCLEIERELEWRDEDDDSPRARALALVRARLIEQPRLQLDELRQAVLNELGVRVSRASMCRLRHEAGVPLLKRRPSDDPLSPAGKTRSAVGNILKRYPDATLKELIRHVEQEHGLMVSTSNMARIRQDLHRAESGVASACKTTE